MSRAGQDLVLIAEDNDLDALMIERALKRIRPDVRIMRAETGDAAIDALDAPDACEPDLILMDIRMPRMDGREALTRIKSDEGLKRIPIVMMSTSKNEEDIEYCYRNHANAYVVKPLDPRSGAEKIESLIRFWLDTAER